MFEPVLPLWSWPAHLSRDNSGGSATNLFGKIDAFTPILRLKDETEFTWGAKQQEAFEKIKICLSSPPVLKAPRTGIPFRLYVAAEDKVIGAVLTQETEGKEYIITYLSRQLIDAETMDWCCFYFSEWCCF